MSEHAAGLFDGRYRLEAPAGRGGMAHVWRASDVLRGGRAVAIKRILPALANESAMHALLADEARVTAGFAHENIVGLEHAGTHDGAPYLALEWVEGGTVGELLVAGGALPSDVAVRIALDVLHALSFAHARGARRAPVIHRDISPANVLVDESGVAKLADFGLARSLAHARSRARGTAPGKLAYLPPEVLAGAPHGTRGDLYGVGVVLWEALAGRRLFEGSARDPHVAHALLHAPRTPLRDAVPHVSSALAAVVDRAVAFDPAQRFASADAMADALRAVSVASREGVGDVVRARRDPRAGRSVARAVECETPLPVRLRAAEAAALLASAMRFIDASPVA